MIASKYKELDYACYLYENGLQDHSHIFNELRLVAIYMKRILGYTNAQLKVSMYSYAQKYMQDYNVEKDYVIINKAINLAKKKDSTLINIDDIPIYKKELDYISNCVFKVDGTEYKYSHDCRKLMFTILVKMKIGKCIFDSKNQNNDKSVSMMFFKGGKKKYSDLKKMANIESKVNISKDLLNAFCDNNYSTPMYTGLIKFDFMGEIKDLDIDYENESPEIVISDFENIGYYYDYYVKDIKTVGCLNIIKCENCGKLVKKKSPNDYSTKYCSECAEEVTNENWRKATRKYREKMS